MRRNEVVVLAEESCKQSLEITVPVGEVERVTKEVVESFRQNVKIPGFRPGKVPPGIIQGRFKEEIRKKVLEELVPTALREEVEKQDLPLVGNPDISELHFEPGEPLRFKAEFEVMPSFDLEEYQGLETPYQEPEVTDEDLDKRMEQIRDQRATFATEDPRPVVDGDYAVLSLKSVGGIEGTPIEHDEMVLHVGDESMFAEFSENVRAMQPGEQKEFDVAYPDDYGEERLAGRTVRFQAVLNEIRRKELPDLDDEFAKDLGDYQDIGELRNAVRSSMLAERELVARQEAKTSLVEKLVDMHQFPVPEVIVDRQIEGNIQLRLRELMAQGVDPRNLKLDWQKVKDAQGDRARRDVKASMILDKIAEREHIEVTVDEVDQQVQRVARERREPAVAVKKQLEEAGELRRIASRIRTEKTLDLLFEKARKVAPATE